MGQDSGVNSRSSSSSDRFDRLERPGDDFPFYDGVPVRLTGRHWALVSAATVAALGALFIPATVTIGAIGLLLLTVLFSAIPLAVLARVAPGHWKALFRPVRLADVGVMVGYALLALIISGQVARVAAVFAGMEPNPIIDVIEDADGAGRSFIGVLIAAQIFWEELLGIIPFLALLALLHARGWSRRRSVLVALLLSSTLFGVVHLSTYGWNIAQSLLVIGSARAILTLAYIRTKNLWVAFGTHVIYDGILLVAAIQIVNGG